jgi:hypothetical protein
MNQEEIHGAGMFIAIAKNGPYGARGIGSKMVADLHYVTVPKIDEQKIGMTSGYPQDAERR